MVEKLEIPLRIHPDSDPKVEAATIAHAINRRLPYGIDAEIYLRALDRVRELTEREPVLRRAWNRRY